MKIGDKVRSIRSGEVGKIVHMTLMNKPSETTNTTGVSKIGKPYKYFGCLTEDFKKFSEYEDGLELIE